MTPLDFNSYNSIPTPKLLYKYFKYYEPDKSEWTKRIFENNEIYFAAPKNFNDPFDSMMRFVYPTSIAEREHFLKLCVRRSLPNLPAEVADLKVRGSVKSGDDIQHMEKICDELTYEMQRSNAVFCMTEKKDDILMWAHYAGEHNGFCLEFITDNSFFSRVQPVIYSRYLPKQNLVEFLTTNIRQLPLYLVTKAEEWAYEKEWRLGDPGPGSGPREFPPESLTGVICGCRMSQNNRDQLKQWCSAREPRPKLFDAKEKKDEFGLDIIPISY